MEMNSYTFDKRFNLQNNIYRFNWHENIQASSRAKASHAASAEARV
jgi:hypothetical protein